MKRTPTMGMMLALLALVTLFAVPVCASALFIFEDQFAGSTLPTGWTTDAGRGDYSLTDNPGYLRYTIDADHTSRWGTAGYAKSLWLVRPFSGSHWLLRTAITCNMRPSYPTNNRNAYFAVETPDNRELAYFFRSAGDCDNNPFSNQFALDAGAHYSQFMLPGTSPCIYPLPMDRWYIEIERDGDHVTVRASNDGDDSNFEYSVEDIATPGTFGNDQQVIIEGDGWYGSNSPPGYFEFDFITVTQQDPTAVQGTTWGAIKDMFR